jgi:putative zinc finger/helix-turn-helix YgiT family protein
MEGTLMAATKTKFCENCQVEVESKIVERCSTYTFKGQSFEITERALICDCGTDLYDEMLDSETMKTLTKMYEDRMGLALDEIKSIRSQYGLSMDLFSRILGWSKSTIARYESGKFIPDASHMSVLKRLKDHPEAIDDYYKLNQHNFNEKEQKKISEKLASSDHSTVERELINVLHINYKLHEKTIESGYSSFQLNKLINMILFFTKTGVQKTKLMKLLFYADFLNYKENMLSMSGTPYVRLPYGPVPKDHDLCLSSIEKNDLIDVNYEFINDYTLINIKSKQSFDKSVFTPEELKILEFVQEHFKHYGSVAISDFSHEEDAWKCTDDREIISYDYADALKIDVN